MKRMHCCSHVTAQEVQTQRLSKLAPASVPSNWQRGELNPDGETPGCMLSTFSYMSLIIPYTVSPRPPPPEVLPFGDSPFSCFNFVPESKVLFPGAKFFICLIPHFAGVYSQNSFLRKRTYIFLTSWQVLKLTMVQYLQKSKGEMLSNLKFYLQPNWLAAST